MATTQETAFPGPPDRVVRWQPPETAGNDPRECSKVWQDNVVCRRDFEAAHPDIIWPPRHEPGALWVAYVPLPDDSFLEVTATELGRLLDKLEIAVAFRDAQRQQST
jgi:hypothetical protein